ncbi:MAG TPA: spore germination protein GerW family protein [Thermoanaerobaculia bacterium]|nr:spore germination protein GerW family protein [Thermoanaerobaculia bacterium]
MNSKWSERSETAGLESAEGPTSLFSRLADRLGVAAKATTVFGEAVERDGVTVIPVAKARWGLGAGGGHQRPGTREGIGGGGGVIVAPVGYIEIKDGTSRFRQIWDPLAAAGVALAAGALLVWALARSRD